MWQVIRGDLWQVWRALCWSGRVVEQTAQALCQVGAVVCEVVFVVAVIGLVATRPRR